MCRRHDQPRFCRCRPVAPLDAYLHAVRGFAYCPSPFTVHLNLSQDAPYYFSLPSENARFRCDDTCGLMRRSLGGFATEDELSIFLSALWRRPLRRVPAFSCLRDGPAPDDYKVTLRLSCTGGILGLITSRQPSTVRTGLADRPERRKRVSFRTTYIRRGMSSTIPQTQLYRV